MKFRKKCSVFEDLRKCFRASGDEGKERLQPSPDHETMKLNLQNFVALRNMITREKMPSKMVQKMRFAVCLISAWSWHKSQ